MIVLGVDPGYARLGYGILRKGQGRKFFALAHGVWETKSGEEHSQRLLQLRRAMEKTINEFSPDVVALEKLFFAKNQKTAIQVAEARGVVLLTAAEHSLTVFEFSPLEIKMAITGNGRASKENMQQMVQTLLNLEQIPRPDDAADGLAIALTYLHSADMLQAIEQSKNSTKKTISIGKTDNIK